MKILIAITILIMSCSKPNIEEITNRITGMDTLPEFVVKAPVKVYVESNLNDGVKWAVNEAVNNWNELKVLHFEIVGNRMESNIIVRMGETGTSEALGILPSNIYRPGNEILISNKTGLNRFLLVKVIMHELGHNIGFRHIYSNESVMDIVHRQWEGWSKFDLTLIKSYYN